MASTRLPGLPVQPPLSPMLSKSAAELPPEGDMLYEPKWDGFRCIVFRSGDEVVLGSRNERPLTRYFPELLDPLRAALADRCVVDGEVVVATEHGLDFDVLSNRLHPAESRVRMLAETTPASFVAFDLIAEGDEDLRGVPLETRRARLEAMLEKAEPPIHLTPATRKRDQALDWFTRFEGAGLDGVVAKRLDLTYQPDKRVMVKVKHARTADCVVGGFRWHKSGADMVGSLLLGLYDEDGNLHHVGVCGAFPTKMRRELVDEIAPWRENAAEDHPWAEWSGGDPSRQRPGNRWNAKKDQSFELLRPERVVEVAYEKLQGGRRFRHTAQFRHWRPDRDPSSCTFDQLETVVPHELREVFAGA